MLGTGNVIGIEDLGKVHTTTVTCISQSGLLIAIGIDDFVRYIREIKKTQDVSKAVDKMNRRNIKQYYNNLSLQDTIKRESQTLMRELALSQHNTITPEEFFHEMYWEEPISEVKKTHIFEVKEKQSTEFMALQESNRKKAAKDVKVSMLNTVMVEPPLTPDTAHREVTTQAELTKNTVASNLIRAEDFDAEADKTILSTQLQKLQSSPV